MSCSRETKTNGNISILFDKLYDILGDETLAEEAYAEIENKSFQKDFGDFASNYKNTNTISYSQDISDRTDENGEPALFFNSKLNKYYYKDKHNQKVYYPYQQGLSQFFNTNQIKLIAKTMAFKYFETIDFDVNESTFKVNKNLRPFIKNYLESKSDELLNSEDQEQFSIGLGIEDSINNIDDWVKEVQDSYSTIKANYSIEEAENELIEESEEAGRGDLMRQESFTVSSKNNINDSVKLFLSLMKNDELNELNEFNFISFDEIYSTLNKSLSNKVAITDNNENLYNIYLAEIKDLIKIKPYMQGLYDKLSSPSITDNFKNKFTSTFNLFKKNYLISETSVDEDGNITYVVKNISEGGSKKNNLLNNWYFTYKNITKNKPQYIKQLADEAYVKLSADNNKIKDITPYLNDLKAIFKQLGISYTDAGLAYFKNGLTNSTNTLEQDKQFLLDSYEKINRIMDSEIENADENIFIDQSYFKKLAEAEAFFELEGTDASVFTMGKSKWFFSNPSYLDLKVEEWKKNPQSLIDLYESSDYHGGSHWMEYLSAVDITDHDARIVEAKKRLSEVIVGVFNSVQTKNDSINGFDNKNISYTDSLVDYLNKTLAFKKGAKVFHKTALAADKSTEYQIYYGNNSDYFTLSAGLTVENGKFKVSNRVLDIFYKYFKSEYDRIITVYDEIQSGEGTIPNYHLGNKNGLKSQLIPSLSDNSVLKLYDVKGKPLYKNLDEIKGDIQEHISDKLNELIIKNYNKLLDNKVFEYDENGNRINKLLDSSIYNKYKSSAKNVNHIFHEIAADFLVNSLISQVEYSKMFTGDIAYYKDISDYKKRVPETYTDGKYLNNLTEEELIFNASVISGVEIGYQDMVSLKESLSPEVYSYYEEGINDTDAQAWITPQRWKFIMDKLGKTDKTVEKLYKKMFQKNPSFNPNELKVLAQPLKGVYFEITDGKPVYLKYSQAVLLPNLIKGTKLEDIFNKMTKDENGKTLDYNKQVHELITRDGVKVGYPSPTTTHDENGNLLDNFDLHGSIMELDNSKWKLQQDLPTKGMKSTAIGSQIQKNIFQGLLFDNLNKDFYVNDDVFKGNDVVNAINSVTNALSKKGMDNIRLKLGLNENLEITNPELLYDNLIQQLQKRVEPNHNLIEALKLGTSPYGVPGGFDMFQNVFSSLINKETVKISTNGGGFIQMANYGLDAENAAKQNIIYTPWHDKKHLPMPEVYYDANGRKRLKPAGIFISGSFIAKYFPGYKNVSPAKLFGTEENNYTDGIIDKKILENIIGYRIPNQGLASNDSLQILGILPEEIGDTVIAYTGITKKTGSDFDIDKMYLMIPSFNVEKEKRINVTKYVNTKLKGNSLKDTVSNLGDLLSKIDNRFYLEDVNTYEDLNMLKDYYSDELVNYLNDYDGTNVDLVNLQEENSRNEVVKFRYVEYDSTLTDEQQSADALKNKLIELYKGVLTSEHVIDDVFTPIDLDYIENDIKSLLPVEENNDFENFSAIEDLQLKNEFTLAKAGLGQNVNALVDSVRGAMGELKFTNYSIGLGLVNEKGETIFDEEYSESLTKSELDAYLTSYNAKIKEYNKTQPKANHKKKLTKTKLNSFNRFKLSQSMMVLANGFVDVAKDSYIAKGNWVTQTNNVGFMLLRAGVHPFKVNAILNQPFVKDFIKYRSNMESNAIKDTSNLFTKFLLDQIYKKVDSTIGENSVVINGIEFRYNNIFKSILTTNMVLSNHKAVMNEDKDNNGEAYQKLLTNLNKKLKSKFKITPTLLKNNPELYQEISDVRDEILKHHDDMFKKMGKLTNPLSLTTLRSQINNESSNDNQLYYLNLFNKLNNDAKKLSKNVKASKVDVDGKGKDIISTIIYNNIIKNILNKSNEEGELYGFSTKLSYDGSPTILKTYLDNSVGFAYRIMKSNPVYFFTASDNVISTFNAVSKHVYGEFLENEKLGQLLQKEYYSYLLSGFPPLRVNSKNKSKLIEDLPSKVLKLRDKLNEAGESNALLDAFYFENADGFDFISMPNIKKSSSAKRDLVNGWETLLETHPSIAEDLIKYSYLISGFNNSKNQFHEFIPPQWFNKNKFNSYIISKIGRLNGVDNSFINQFFRNNLKNNTLSKLVFDSQLGKDKGADVIEIEQEHLEGVDKPYLVRRQVQVDELSGRKENYYYKIEGLNENGSYYFTRVTPLGYKDLKGNKFVEYNINSKYGNTKEHNSFFTTKSIKKLDTDYLDAIKESYDSSEYNNSLMIDDFVNTSVDALVESETNDESESNIESVGNYNIYKQDDGTVDLLHKQEGVIAESITYEEAIEVLSELDTKEEDVSKAIQDVPFINENFDFKLSEATNHSGGALGADMEWDRMGEKFGIAESKHYYIEGHKTPKGNSPIRIEDKMEADEKLKAANITLKRTYPTSKEYVNDLLRRNWWQVKNADAIFAISTITNNKVDGGTGWAVHMGIAENKPVHVFDQKVKKWFTWNGNSFVETAVPVLTKNFAGIGTRKLLAAGVQAIEDVYTKTKGFSKESDTKTNTANTVKRYTVQDVRNNPDKIYVFGDNNQRKGKGGQAIIRNEENAFGISTKIAPARTEDAYMSDRNIGENMDVIDHDIDKILSDGREVIFPEDGLGTGLAKLKEKAPETFEYLNKRLMEEFGFNNGQTSNTANIPGIINIYSTEKNGYEDLSNFDKRPFTADNFTGDKFDTVEGAFQAEKIYYSSDLSSKKKLDNGSDELYTTLNEKGKALYKKLQTSTGAKSKSLGRGIKGLNVKEWDKVSERIMADNMRFSFEQNPKALEKLLSTGTAKLTHTQDKGKWGKLFPKILMEVRDELRPENVTPALSEQELARKKQLDEVGTELFKIIKDAKNTPVINKLKTEGKIVLNKGQVQAKSEILEFISNPERNTHSLIGYAGTGKTTLINSVEKDILANNRFAQILYSSPTHRANAVTKLKNPNAKVFTLHTILGLSPEQDLEKFNAKDAKFTQKSDVKVSSGQILIIDESSMISDELYKFITDKLVNKGVKILFVGDDAQLKPVKQTTTSKALTSTEKVSSLTEVMRANNNAVLNESMYVREHGDLTYSNNVNDNNDGIRYMNNKSDFLNGAYKMFTSKEFKTDPLLIRVLSGTNKEVKSFNSDIRRGIYGQDAKQYEVGDIIMGYGNWGVDYRTKQPALANGGDYIVKSVKSATHTVEGINVEGYYVMLGNILNAKQNDFEVFVLDENTSPAKINELGGMYESIRLKAIALKNEGNYRGAAMQWARLSAYKDSFASPFDITYQGRTKLNKVIDYGYAHTIHKSQGGTYSNVYILEDTINAFRDKDARSKLKYVAVTRAEDNVIIYTNKEISDTVKISNIKNPAQELNDIWENNKDVILDKHPSANKQYLELMLEFGSMEDVKDYMKKCYGVSI